MSSSLDELLEKRVRIKLLSLHWIALTLLDMAIKPLQLPMSPISPTGTIQCCPLCRQLLCCRPRLVLQGHGHLPSVTLRVACA